MFPYAIGIKLDPLVLEQYSVLRGEMLENETLLGGKHLITPDVV